MDIPNPSATLFDPPALPREDDHPGFTMQSVLENDRHQGPSHLREDMQRRLGTEPIPASRYYDPEWAKLERDKVWMKTWQMACWSYDIPNPGDIYVYRILEKSVLIIRQRDGSLKALVNSCLHRGRELCDKHSSESELKCPYHYFTWALDGAVKWIPSKWDFPQIEEDKFRLPEIRLAEWNGFVFVCFDNDAPSLEDYLGKRMLDHWQSWDCHKRYKAVHFEKHINCNWKTGQDAFIEGFHAFATHSQGAIYSSEDCGQVDIFEDAPHISRFVLPLGIPSHRLEPQPTDEEVFGLIVGAATLRDVGNQPDARLEPGESLRHGYARLARSKLASDCGLDPDTISDCEAIDAISYFVFPNFMPWGSLTYPLVYRFRPGKDPDWCIWEAMLLRPFKGERPPSCETIVLGPDDPLRDVEALGGLALVLHQDAVNLPLVQSGMKTLEKDEMAVSEYQELRIRHYHALLSEYIAR